jgi:hypothetical protein
MSKTYSNAIFELIKSMSKGEKRYFKIFSSRHTIGEENNYIRLFDYIESLETYDETVLFDHFQGEAFLNKFSITKNRLYDNIMRSLDSFHAGNSIDAQLFRMIHGADILFNKGLYDHAHKQLRSAEKLAAKHEKKITLQEIKLRQKKLIETFNYAELDELEREQLANEDFLLEQQLSYYNQLWHIKSQLFMRLNKKGKARNAVEKKVFEDLYCQLQQIKQPLQRDFETEYLYNHIHSAFYFAISNEEQSLHYLLMNASLFKNNHKRIQQEPNTYFSILTNIIHVLVKKGRYSQAQQYLNELKGFHHTYAIERSLDMDIKYFTSVTSTELMIYNHSGQFRQAIELAGVVAEGLRIHDEILSPGRKAFLRFEMAVSFFGAEDFHSSLKWINELLNDNHLDEKEDIAAFAHIINIIIHYELKNDRLLPYAIKSALRFLKKRARTYAVETLMIKSLSKVIRAENQFVAADIFTEIEQKLEQITQDDFECVALEYFDFKTWLESKRKHLPFQELKRQNFLKSTVAA